MKQKVIFCWSGGKDSAQALHELRRTGEHEIAALMTTVTADYGRVSMHGFREELLDCQAAALGLPLEKVLIPKECTNEIYETRMSALLEKYKAQGVRTAVFGDIFLEDLRSWREEKLAQIGFTALFPIWKRNTTELARSFIDLTFRAVLTCVDTTSLDGSFAGRSFDRTLLKDLPDSVDPCGENGEFHSFVHDGPIFREPIAFKIGERVLREERFSFCDLIPVG
jgi:uncharacterized protein (TIGR00290 family)